MKKILSILCSILIVTLNAEAGWKGGGGGGGSGTPGGSDTQVQYNDGGAFGGEAAFTYNKTTNTLTVSGTIAGTTVTGTNVTSGTDPGHNHTATSISGLGITDFTTSVVSQWYNDSGYLTSANGVSSIIAGNNIDVSSTVGDVTISVETLTSSDISDFDVSVTTLLTDANIPNTITIDNATNVTGTVAIANGGTGAVSAQTAINALLNSSEQGDIIYYNGTNWVHLAHGTSGQVLQSGGDAANPSWTAAGGVSEIQISFSPQQGKIDYDISLLENGEDAWGPAANVTATVVAGQVGTNAMSITVSSAHTTGLAASEAITSINISSGSMVQVWVRSSVTLAASDYAILLDDSASCASAVHVLNLPALTANVWTLVQLGYNGSATGSTAIISVGIRAVVDKGALTFDLDDMRILSAAAIDGSEYNWSALCDAVLDEGLTWQEVLDDDYSAATLYADIYWIAATATTGTISWSAYIQAQTVGDSENVNLNNLRDGVYGAAGYSTANTVTSATAGTAGYLNKSTITLTNADSLAAGDYFKFHLRRNAFSDAADTMTGDAKILKVIIRQ